MVKADSGQPGVVQPLKGRTILVTRARHQAADLVALLAASGARVIEAPVIDIVDPASWVPADEAIAHLDRYDIAVFTSANAAVRFHERLERVGRSIPSGGTPRLVAIGSATARCLAERGLTARGVATVSRAEGVLKLLGETDLRGRRVLIPRATVAAETLPEGLRARGAIVDVVPVYRTVGLPIDEEVRLLLASGKVDLVTFASASAVCHLLAGIGGAGKLGGARVAVVGPVTALAARDAGLTPEIVAREAGMASLAEAIVSSYSSR